MKIKVTNCLDCPFLVEEIDYDTTNKEVLVKCGLSKFLKTEAEKVKIYKLFDYEQYSTLTEIEPFSYCKLKNKLVAKPNGRFLKWKQYI